MRRRDSGEESLAIFKCGEIMGLASSINTGALEEFLKDPPGDFRYAPFCKAVLELAKLVRGETKTTNTTKEDT